MNKETKSFLLKLGLFSLFTTLFTFVALIFTCVIDDDFWFQFIGLGLVFTLSITIGIISFVIITENQKEESRKKNKKGGKR